MATKLNMKQTTRLTTFHQWMEILKPCGKRKVHRKSKETTNAAATGNELGAAQETSESMEEAIKS